MAKGLAWRNVRFADLEKEGNEEGFRNTRNFNKSKS